MPFSLQTNPIIFIQFYNILAAVNLCALVRVVAILYVGVCILIDRTTKKNIRRSWFYFFSEIAPRLVADFLGSSDLKRAPATKPVAPIGQKISDTEGGPQPL